MLPALALIGAALAEPLPVDIPVTAIVGDGDTLLAVGPEGSVVIAVGTGERRPLELAAREALLADLDGEGGLELVTCGEAGLQLWSWPAREPLASAEGACRAMARLPRGVVRLGEAELVQYAYYQGAWIQEYSSPVEVPEGEVALAAGGGLVAFAALGEAGLSEHSPRGLSSLATGGEVAGLARLGEHWLWSVAAEDVVYTGAGGERLTAREPGRLLRADVDADGREDLIVAHADRVGVLRGEGSEQLLAHRGPVEALGVETRPCGAVWVAGGGSLRSLGSLCEGPPAVSAAPPAPSTPAPGVSAPAPQAAPPAPAAAAPGQPSTGAIVLDGRSLPQIRAVVGQPLQVQLQASGGQAMSFAARGGPEGMVVYPDGTLMYTPRPGQEGRYRVSVRMSAGITRRAASIELLVEAGAAVAPTPAAPAPTTTAAAPAPVTTGGEGDYRLVPRRRSSNSCYFGLGAATALTDVGLSFTFPGQRVVGSVSPRLSLTCEGDDWPMAWWIRGSTAPWLFYVTAPDEVAANSVAVGSIGLAWGSERASAGGYVTAGLIAAGIGARGAWRPIETRTGKRAGLVLDVLLYVPSRFAAGANLMWELPL